ncbi:hypothetical protein [Kitasatospora sp. NPDC057198]|uniref:hypothetical protein n=1 Tax=Kitasatospora sp. NPDC057198 TaxID=3346046 RepID=UPI003625F2AE
MSAGASSSGQGTTTKGRAVRRETRRVVVQFAVAAAVVAVLVLASPWIVYGLARVYDALHA